ncbi:MAG: NAD(P)/FAD-dependent oxidoreductase [Ruminococcus sp.]
MTTRCEKICYKNKNTGEETIFDSADDTFGIFVFAGYAPNTDLVKDPIALDSHGYVETDRTQKTSCPGIYAAGDVCQKNLRQVVTAVGDGATAATELEKYAAAMQGKPESTRKSQSKKRPKFTRNHPQEKKQKGKSSAGIFHRIS